VWEGGGAGKREVGQIVTDFQPDGEKGTKKALSGGQRGRGSKVEVIQVEE